MGFGGINAHVVLESLAESRREGSAPSEGDLLASTQDTELFLLGGHDAGGPPPTGRRTPVVRRAALAGRAGGPGHAPGGDARGSGRPRGDRREPSGRARGAVESLRDGCTMATDRETGHIDLQAGVFLGSRRVSAADRLPVPRPGIAGNARRRGLGRRFASVEALYQRAGLPAAGDLRSTDVAQPRDHRGVAGGAERRCSTWASRPMSPSAIAWASWPRCTGRGTSMPGRCSASPRRGAQAMAGLPGEAGAMASVEAERGRGRRPAQRRARGDRRPERPAPDGDLGPGRGGRGGRRSGAPARLGGDSAGGLPRVPLADGGRGRRARCRASWHRETIGRPHAADRLDA